MQNLHNIAQKTPVSVFLNLCKYTKCYSNYVNIHGYCSFVNNILLISLFLSLLCLWPSQFAANPANIAHYSGGWTTRLPAQLASLAKPLVLVVYLKYKFKLKSMTIRENNKKLMRNEYLIEISSKIDWLMWVFWKSNCI